MVEVQSDKASVEITSRYSGVIKTLDYKEGEVAKVGSSLCSIEMEVEGEGEETSQVQESIQAQEPVQVSQSSTNMEAFESSNDKSSTNEEKLSTASFKATSSKNSPTLAVPAVRRLSKEKGIDIELIKGTGKDGRVKKEDLLDYLETQKNGGSITASSSSPASSNQAASGRMTLNTSEVTSTPLSPIRKAMFKSMTSSLQIPHFGYSHYLDLTSLNSNLEILNSQIPPSLKVGKLSSKEEAMLKRIGLERVPEEKRIQKLTMLSLLTKALDLAMREFPLFRSELTLPVNPSINLSDAVSQASFSQNSGSLISIALSTPTGLLTPTLPILNNLTPFQVASHIKGLQSKSSLKGLSSLDLKPDGKKGTVTLSNIGSVASGIFAMPVIPPTGQLAIAAIGRVQEVPNFQDQLPGWKGEKSEKIVRRLQVGISWSADHRVVEGAELAAFAERWKELVENPEMWVGLIA